MNIFSIAAAAVCISLVTLLVKSLRPEMGQIITVAAVTVITAALVPYIMKVISSMQELAAYSKSGRLYVEPIIKITAIAYISQIGAQLCEDSGEKTLAARVESAGKIAICVIAIPIAKEAFIKIIGILS